MIGAGVSGCACAAALVERGVRVQLLNSALDRVGHPGYGPELVSARGRAGVVEALAALPRAVRDVWVEAGVISSAGGDEVVAVDRRRISVELKRVLESLPGLEFRQGLVNDVRLTGGVGEAVGHGREQGATRVTVETVFGEVFEAEAVVVAVGLGLGGVVVAGEDVMPGGRYGETRAEGLVGALERLGARLREEGIEVGPRFLLKGFGSGGTQEVLERLASGGGACATGQVQRAVPLSDLFREDEGAFEGSGGWPRAYPPAPHWTKELQPAELYVGATSGTEWEWLVLPDGCALGEVYVSPDPRRPLEGGSCGAAGDSAVVASRLGQEVRALVVTDLGDAGRLRAKGAGEVPIWVTGRAGGSRDYLGSLQAGTLTGVAVAEALAGVNDGTR